MNDTLENNPLKLMPGNEGRLLKRFFVRSIEKLSCLDALQGIYEKLPASDKPGVFLEQLVDQMNISYETGGTERNIPRNGRTIVIANHPFGAADGLIMAHLLTKLRPDLKILANEVLQRIEGIRSLIFPVDVFNNDISLNQTSMRGAIRWLERGGLLLVFPSGVVSHFRPGKWKINDPDWHETVARIALRTCTPVVPVYIHGHNSLAFQLLGMIHPLLRTFMLPREFLKQTGKEMHLSIGKCIPVNTLRRVGDYHGITNFLRFCTYTLEGIIPREVGLQKELKQVKENYCNRKRTSKELHSVEIKHLPRQQCLVQVGNLQVYYALANQIPWTLQEIGRMREITFREIGEGTGKDVDLSLYDSYYYHLFIWNNEKKEIIGAYRLGLVDEILKKYGINGLYTYSLFNYRRNLLKQINPAIELGRSFIRKEYQQSFLALNLLWQGIGVFVAGLKKYSVLFGPVSISDKYDHLSRKFMIDCLQLNLTEDQLSGSVKPRNPFRSEGKQFWSASELRMFSDINLVSNVVSQIEKDNKGLPVLFRQYIKLGGKFLCFNVDDNFSDVVDGLIMVDLTRTDRRMLDKYMGQEKAAMFIEYHENKDEFFNFRLL